MLLLVAAPVVAEDVDEATGLIKDDGWLQVRAHCGGCHSHALVTSQRASRNAWEAMIRWRGIARRNPRARLLDIGDRHGHLCSGGLGKQQCESGEHSRPPFAGQREFSASAQHRSTNGAPIALGWLSGEA